MATHKYKNIIKWDKSEVLSNIETYCKIEKITKNSPIYYYVNGQIYDVTNNKSNKVYTMQCIIPLNPKSTP